MNEQENSELEVLRGRIESHEEIYAILSNDPRYSIEKDWFAVGRDDHLKGKLCLITGCHCSVKEAMNVKAIKGVRYSKYLHYRDLEIIPKEKANEMLSTVFHFDTESLAV